jgi:hypothetical protein
MTHYRRKLYLAALAFHAYTSEVFKIHFEADYKGCKMTDMNRVTTLIVGEETSTLAWGEEATTEAIGEEGPSTSPQGEENPSARPVGEQTGHGPFGAY